MTILSGILNRFAYSEFWKLLSLWIVLCWGTSWLLNKLTIEHVDYWTRVQNWSEWCMYGYLACQGSLSNLMALIDHMIPPSSILSPLSRLPWLTIWQISWIKYHHDKKSISSFVNCWDIWPLWLYSSVSQN